MARHLAFSGVSRPMARSASSVACRAFVALMGPACWAGAVWIGETLLRWSAGGF